jgi:Zn-finger nucleic acid-binding protein
MAARQGLEVDSCLQWPGVWLDRGELDRIIERSTNAGDPVPAAPKACRGEEYREVHSR